MPGFLGTDIPLAVPSGEAPANLGLCSGENASTGCGSGTPDHQFNQEGSVSFGAAEAQEANQDIIKKQNPISSKANPTCGIDKHDGGPVRRYARSELEELRYVWIEEQKRGWKEVYEGLESAIKDEYDLLGGPPPRKNNQKQQKRKPKKETHTAADKVSAESTPIYLDMQDFSGHVWSNSSVGEDSITNTEDLYDEYYTIDDEDESNNDEYDSIRRPAFLVEGEPDLH